MDPSGKEGKWPSSVWQVSWLMRWYQEVDVVVCVGIHKASAEAEDGDYLSRRKAKPTAW